jgi:hypothetical protein
MYTAKGSVFPIWHLVSTLPHDLSSPFSCFYLSYVFRRCTVRQSAIVPFYEWGLMMTIGFIASANICPLANNVTDFGILLCENLTF